MRSSRSARVFWLCLAASVALHYLFVAELPNLALYRETPEPVLHARLLAPPPVAAVRPSAPAPKPKPKPKPKPRQTPVPAAATSGPQEPLASGPAWSDEEPATSAESETPQAEAAPPTPDVAATPEATPTPEPAAAEASAETAPTVDKGTIRYEVYYGSDRFSVGRSIQTWSIEQKSYRITSFSETTGLVGLFKPYQYAYVAEGRVEPEGLRPESFQVRRGREGRRQASARFDWENRQLTYGSRGAEHSAPLNARSYDLLTLFYQLARMPLTPGRLQFSVTTGTKFERYTLEVGAEQSLELPLGTLRAIPLKQLRTPGEESVEVWLAPEQRYLPVLIRFFDRDGKLSAEQVATQIAMDTVAGNVR